MKPLRFLYLTPILLVCLSLNLPNTASEYPRELLTTSRTIILIRHAKSSRENPDWMDFERPLSDRGEKDAPKMGQKLKGYELSIDQIIASPSKRTTQTAELICKELDYDINTVTWDSSIYRCSTDKLLGAIKKIQDGHRTVIIIGHNPSLTGASNYLQKDTSIAKVPTCGILSITFATPWKDIEAGSGNLNFFEYPKKDKK